MINILIDMPVYQPLLGSLKQMSGVEVEIIDEPQEKVRTLPIDQLKKCDVLFCTFPPENHREMTNLKMIQISSAGYSQLAGLKLPERDIKACNARGVFDIPIAEWNIAMMINLTRDLRGIIRNQESQIWDRSARFQREIRGSVLGIWGYGGIGRETARLASCLGMKVRIMTSSGIHDRKNIYCVPGTGDVEGKLPEKVFFLHEKEEFLNGLDFLIMAIPQTDKTEGIIGERELKMLKPQAYVLNPARGPLIQEQALLKALRNNWIAGAAIDTHYYYPMPSDHPLWSMPNVIMTPHISGSSASSRFLERVWHIFIQNVSNLQAGKPLLNELSSSNLN